MISRVSRRGVKGGKRPDVQSMRAMIGSQQMTSSLGVVRKFEGETSHFDLDTENGSLEVLVDVELIPSGTRTLCRLGFGQDGVHKIPRVGSEVAVMIPYDPSSLIKDSLDYEGIIVGVLQVNTNPKLTGDDVVVVSAPKVIIDAPTSVEILTALAEIKTDGGQSEKMIKGETYRSSEDQVLTKLSDALSAANEALAKLALLTTGIAALAPGAAPPGAGLIDDPTAVLAADVTAAATSAIVILTDAIDQITGFKAVAPLYLATVGKVE